MTGQTIQPLDLNPGFPPLLYGRPVLEPHDPFEAAVSAAGSGEAEAGDLFWSCVQDRISFAVVLEPEVERARAQEMLFVLMVACADALGAISPPELAITWTWPAAIFGNAARLGDARMAISDSDDPEGAPDWMVIGLNLALKPSGEGEPGKTPEKTTLWDEGAVDVEAVPALESLSRHFLTWVHRWETDSFKPVHEAWLFRCDGYRKDVQLGDVAGAFTGLDDKGNLLLKTDGGVESFELLPHLEAGVFAKPVDAVEAGA
ncbi:biotin/lipoate--protein ligase family protein [Roseibium sp.]|uniref:biotin/lipoate--protein ligase family protein n=1 Tax=Roseibium sp. TaxID=1936156 RepID=UPI003A977F4F